MPIFKEYLLPDTCEHAIENLQHYSSAKIIAGGTDLLLDLQQGRHQPVDALVDITKISELNQLEIRGQDLFIGSAVPLNQIAGSPLVLKYANALAEACGMIGGPQVRNMATLGGNVAHALPAADGSIALTALASQVEIFSLNGVRHEPISTIFKGPGKSNLRSDEIIVGFCIPLNYGSGATSAFNRIMRPQGVALPILNMAIWLFREVKKIRDIRIAIGPAGLTPQRGLIAEEKITGQLYDEHYFTGCIEELIETLKFRTSPYRASKEYRQHLCVSLFIDTIRKAWNKNQ